MAASLADLCRTTRGLASVKGISFISFRVFGIVLFHAFTLFKSDKSLIWEWIYCGLNRIAYEFNHLFK